jgi:hypothetical protein
MVDVVLDNSLSIARTPLHTYLGGLTGSQLVCISHTLQPACCQMMCTYSLKIGPNTSTEHLEAAAANFSIGRVRPAIVGIF